MWERAGILQPDCWGPVSRVAVGPCLRYSNSLNLFSHLHSEVVKSTILVGLWVQWAVISVQHTVVLR